MDKGGRVIGMAIFVLGIVVLLIVLVVAFRMFSAPASTFLPGGGSLTASGLGVTVVWVFVKIALLFVMTLAASMISSRGIQLYLGSCGRS